MEMMLVNASCTLYIFITCMGIYTYRLSLTDDAIHHLLSHIYIVIFFMISINLYIDKGWTIPLVFSLLHALQHITKENFRLITQNDWVKGE